MDKWALPLVIITFSGICFVVGIWVGHIRGYNKAYREAKLEITSLEKSFDEQFKDAYARAAAVWKKKYNELEELHKEYVLRHGD